MFKKKFIKNKAKKLEDSFKHAFEGIESSFKSERNMKIHFVLMIIVIVLGLLFKINIYEWLICIILFGLIISLELVNTAIETVVDMVMPKIDERAKLAKDIAAGAVLSSAIAAAIIGLIIFLPKIIYLFK